MAKSPTALFSRRMPCGEAAGSSKRERLGAFLGHFLPRSKKCQQKTTRSARAEGSQYERPATKSYKI